MKNFTLHHGFKIEVNFKIFYFDLYLTNVTKKVVWRFHAERVKISSRFAQILFTKFENIRSCQKVLGTN